MSFPLRAPLRPLAWVLFTALAVRAAYLACYLNSPLFGTYRIDQLYYRTWGFEIAGGGLIGTRPFEQAPLYAYLLGAWYRLFGPLDEGILVLQLLAGTVTVLLIAWAAEHLFGRAAGIAAGTFAAIYGPAVFYECMVMKTFLEPLLVLAALAAALRTTDSASLRWPVAAGVAVGLACLVREVYALLLTPLLLATWAGTRPGKPRRLASSLALLAAFAGAITPAVVHNRLAGSDLVGITVIGGENAYIAFGPEATGFYAIPSFLNPYAYVEHQDFRDEVFLRTREPHSPAATSRFWLRETWESIRSQPAATARLVIRKAAILFADFEVPDSENYAATRDYIPMLRTLPSFGWIVGLGVLGLALAAASPRQFLLPLGFAAALIAIILVTFNFGRYRSALVGVWLLLAGRGAAGLWEALVRPGHRRSAGLAALTAVSCASALSFLPPLGLDPAQRDRELDRFREEMARNTDIQRALPQLQHRLATDVGDPGLLLELGKGMALLGRLPEAIRAYEAALRASPGHAVALLSLADLRLRQNRPDLAAPHALTLARQGAPGESLYGRYLLGRIALLEASNAPGPAAAQEALSRAIVELRTVVALESGNPEPRLKLARAYHLAGDPVAARAELLRALELDPSSREGISLARTVLAR